MEWLAYLPGIIGIIVAGIVVYVLARLLFRHLEDALYSGALEKGSYDNVISNARWTIAGGILGLGLGGLVFYLVMPKGSFTVWDGILLTACGLLGLALGQLLVLFLKRLGAPRIDKISLKELVEMLKTKLPKDESERDQIVVKELLSDTGQKLFMAAYESIKRQAKKK